MNINSRNHSTSVGKRSSHWFIYWLQLTVGFRIYCFILIPLFSCEFCCKIFPSVVIDVHRQNCEDRLLPPFYCSCPGCKFLTYNLDEAVKHMSEGIDDETLDEAFKHKRVALRTIDTLFSMLFVCCD